MGFDTDSHFNFNVCTRLNAGFDFDVDIGFHAKPCASVCTRLNTGFHFDIHIDVDIGFDAKPCASVCIALSTWFHFDTDIGFHTDPCASVGTRFTASFDIRLDVSVFHFTLNNRIGIDIRVTRAIHPRINFTQGLTDTSARRKACVQQFARQ